MRLLQLFLSQPLFIYSQTNIGQPLIHAIFWMFGRTLAQQVCLSSLMVCSSIKLFILYEFTNPHLAFGAQFVAPVTGSHCGGGKVSLSNF